MCQNPCISVLITWMQHFRETAIITSDFKAYLTASGSSACPCTSVGNHHSRWIYFCNFGTTTTNLERMQLNGKLIKNICWRGEIETSDLYYILIPHHSQNVLKEFNFTFLYLSPKNSSKALRTTISIKHHSHTDMFSFYSKSQVKKLHHYTAFFYN